MLLQIHQLTLDVAQRRLVTELNCQFNSGECWCILGRNGAGKTTLLRSLAGLLDVAKHTGDIFIDHKSLAQWGLSELARVRSYLPQGRNDAFAYQVIETVLAARHPYNDGNYWESEQDLMIAQAALAQLDVAQLASRDVRSLSGGERQRVSIAALLAQNTPLLLLDEPTNSLDLSHQVSVMQLFSSLCKEQQKTVLMVSHDINLAYSAATHALLLMEDGTWLAGPVNHIMTQENLTLCLGHPIELIQQGDRRFFLPV